MTKGFYNLTSGILSQSRRLDTVANNMTNLSTSGYKAEQYTDSSTAATHRNRDGSARVQRTSCSSFGWACWA